MVNLIDRLGTTLGAVVDGACMGFIDAGVAVKKGLLVMGEGASRALYEVYSLQGFEKGSKALIANMEAINRFSRFPGVFDGALKTVRAQKDLIYATLVFESTADFIKVTVDEDTGEKRYSFTLPREKNGDIEWVKLLYGIGNPFDTLGFLHKYKVVSFPFFSKVASQWGGIKVFNRHGEDWAFADIPVFNCLVSKPKDFFVCIASGYSVIKCFTDPKDFLKNPTSFWNKANLIKLVGSIGKIVLITSADYMVNNKYFVALTVADVITQNGSFIGVVMRRSKESKERFNNPTKF